jgi:hypothetical protein
MTSLLPKEDLPVSVAESAGLDTYRGDEGNSVLPGGEPRSSS